MVTSDKIKHVIPATGWYALFGKLDSDGNETVEWVSALCGFAVIVDRHGDERIVGLDGENRDYIDDAEGTGNFLRHIYSPNERPAMVEATEVAS